MTESGNPIKSEHPFSNTYWSAALDAADDIRWPETNPPSDKGVLRSQKRIIERFGRVIGIGVCDQNRERIASILQVPNLYLAGQSQKSRDGPFVSKGEAIVETLNKMPNICIVDRLIQCGTIEGLWGNLLRG